MVLVLAIYVFSHGKWLDEDAEDAPNFNWMLCCAAGGGHRDLCELACAWLEAEGITPNFNAMLMGAAEGGHRDLCILAKEWAQTMSAAPPARKISSKSPSATRAKAPPIDLNEMFWGKASPIDFNEMLWGAAYGGHRDLCILAKEWFDTGCTEGAANFSSMLRGAAQGGHRDLCILARDWARETQSKSSSTTGTSAPPLNFSGMLGYAGMCIDPVRRRDIRELAREWTDAEGANK